MQTTDSEQTLPVALDDKIHLYLPDKDNRKSAVRSRILGCRSRDFLIIGSSPGIEKSPALNDTHFTCVLFHNGFAYYFRTKILKRFPEEALIILSYPDMVRKRKVREHPRVRVKLETLFRVQDKNPHIRNLEDFRGKIFNGTMIDISRGGCLILVQSFRQISIETICSIDFVLPDDQQIEELEAIVVGSEPADGQIHRISLRFLGPFGQLRKIFAFCELAETIQGQED